MTRYITRFLLAACFLSVLATPAAYAQTPVTGGNSAPTPTQADEAAQSREVRATVEEIREDTTDESGIRQMKFSARTESGAVYEIDTAASYTEGLRYNIAEGDTVILQLLPGRNGEMNAVLSDVERFNQLIWIFLLFAFITIVVGFWRGFFSLIGMTITVGILFFWLFPRILDGGDPVLSTVIAAVVILAVNMLLSHGASRNTLVAYGATVVGLLLAVGFSHLFVEMAHLSGLASEESVFLYWRIGEGFDPTGILLAAFILGAVGVLDDIAVTQSETVRELHHANPHLSRREIFTRAMRIGRHHIASTVNTLVLAYAGAAMPLFLLFLETAGVSIHQFVNTELVSEEIVRTLAGTSALVLVVPISTWMSTYFTTDEPVDGTTHVH